MSWQVGDKAVCIKSGNRTREGAVYTVSRIHLPGAMLDGWPNYREYPLLDFFELGINPDSSSGANRFRKVVQDKHEACETEFVTLLKRSKQTVRA